LIIRILLQLASDEERSFPQCALVMRENIYMDDVLAGNDNLKDALEVKAQTEQLLQIGEFQLSNWAESYEILDPNNDNVQ